MAEPLKNSFARPVVERIAGMLVDAPGFDAMAFITDALEGFEPLSLTERARHISTMLARHLPNDVETALAVIVEALGAPIDGDAIEGMDGFVYLPFVFFVADHGLDHFEASMLAQYELTKRFTAEFSIRAFIERYPVETLGRLTEWARDPNVHVRRLVSEGTRPRLPWAPRIRAFVDDPTPVLALLELLVDDPELYVRRSVANNLNDISKDHPEVVVGLCGRLLADPTDGRRWLVRHGLRTLVKAGHPGALALLGYGDGSPVEVAVDIEPGVAAIGGKVKITVTAINGTESSERLLVDLRIHFVKASGATSPKVFKGSELEIGAGERASFTRTVSLAQHTTRIHYPGTHEVDLIVNGQIRTGGAFQLVR
ncbi:MAG: DNA alkylation repair protein [Acidimicrobiia bacterium]|nr:DNA alkylation repair protein [Acidimicrobiia bacterium]MDH5292126.1 DNA alkylation repair protein [Acidimicrobiia bacterium]